MDLYERRAQHPLPAIMKRSSTHTCRGRIANSGVTCWLGSLLQSLFSSQVFHAALACHPNGPHGCGSSGCPLCLLVATEGASRAMTSICDVEPLWKDFVQSRGLSWHQQHDPLHFCMSLFAAAHDFFSDILGVTLRTTVRQTLACACGVEVPPPHNFPPQIDYIVPLKVLEAAADSLSLETLISSMQEEWPENSDRCPICDTQAGFHATHKYNYGPIVLFQVSRVHGSAVSVTLPLELSLMDRRYCLRAAVCHRGDIDSGHYVCFVLDAISASWVRYNDADQPARLSQPPKCLGTHCAYALYEQTMPEADLASLSISVSARGVADETVVPSSLVGSCDGSAADLASEWKEAFALVFFSCVFVFRVGGSNLETKKSLAFVALFLFLFLGGWGGLLWVSFASCVFVGNVVLGKCSL